MTELNMQEQAAIQTTKKGFGCLQVALILFVGIILAVVITFFAIKYFTQNEFKPVSLNAKETLVLEKKLHRLESLDIADKDIENIDLEIRDADSLTPEAYSEEGVSRSVFFTERELNSMLTSNDEMAKSIAIDLADDLVSAKFLMPIPEDFPLFGGKTLRGRAGLKMAFQEGRPIVILKGVSVMGVPIPNAWLGGLKNVDLVEEFGDGEGFWKSFAVGVEYIEVREGQLNLKLKE